MVIFLNFPPTSNHLHPLQVANRDSNSRLVVDEDDNGKFRPERVKVLYTLYRVVDTLPSNHGNHKTFALITTILVFKPFYLQIRTLILGIKCVFQH